MAIRNSPMRRVPGNPLAGVLQQTARKARSTSRRSSVPGPPGPEGPPGPMPDMVPVLATVLTCDAAGVARAEWPPLQFPATVVATPVGVAALVTVSEVTATGVALQAWLPDGVGVAAFQSLHVVAFGQPNYTEAQQPETEGII